MGTSHDVLNERIDELEIKLKKAKSDLRRYKKAYNLLMDYWDYIPEGEDKEELDKQLNRVGL